jgi:hypothetical protein
LFGRRSGVIEERWGEMGRDGFIVPFGFFDADARADISRHDLIPSTPPTFPFLKHPASAS